MTTRAALVSCRGGKATLTDAVPALSGDPRHGGGRAAARRPRGQGHRRAAQRLSWRRASCPAGASPVPEDFNAQLTEWLVRANRRSTPRCAAGPIDRFEEDRAAMMPLPPVLPDTSLAPSTRLGRDHYVRVGTCDYSVHPKVDRSPHRGPADRRRGGRHLCRGGGPPPPRRGPSTGRHRPGPRRGASTRMRPAQPGRANVPSTRRRGPRPLRL